MSGLLLLHAIQAITHWAADCTPCVYFNYLGNTRVSPRCYTLCIRPTLLSRAVNGKKRVLEAAALLWLKVGPFT